MENINSEQVYHILQNLSNLEISYLEYSRSPKDFVEYQTYLDYFNNYIIKSHNLSRFYFPLPVTSDFVLPKYISEYDEITDHMNILPGYDFSVAKQFNFPEGIRHKCNYYTLIYLMDGQGMLYLDEGDFELKEGDFYLVPAEVYYDLIIDAESICLCFNLRRSYVSAEYKTIFQEDTRLTEFITDSLEADSSMTHLVLHTDNNEEIRELTLTIFAEYINQKKYSNNAMKSYLSLLFTFLLRSDETVIESSIKVGRTQQQYQQILDHLKQHYQTADLAEVAEAVHFSKQYVCRIVKSHSGVTFQKLLTQIRLDMVKQYLAETDLSLENIAELCGFGASSHLSKVFKNTFGEAPSVYRKNRRG